MRVDESSRLESVGAAAGVDGHHPRVVSGNSVEVEWTCSEGNVLDSCKVG